MRKISIFLSLLLPLYSCTEEGFVDWHKVGSFLPDSPPPKSSLSISIAQPIPISSTTVEYSYYFSYFKYGDQIDTTIITKGICWSESASPTILNSKKDDGPGFKNVKSQLTGLTPGTKYYIRAYSILADTTIYSYEMTFTTFYVTTISPSSITDSTAVSGGGDCYKGIYTITERGVCWSHPIENPTTDLPNNGYHGKTLDSSGSGNYISLITGLFPSTDYYLRAYVITSDGATHYGNTFHFNTTGN